MRNPNSLNAETRNDALQVEPLLRVLTIRNCAVDIGSHLGKYALIFACYGRACEVVAFGRDPLLRKQFARNVAITPGLSPLLVDN